MSLFLASMEKIQFKMAKIMRGQYFLHTKSMGVFFKRSRADNSAARGRIWLNCELNRDLMYVVVPCKYGKDPIENSGDNAMLPISHYKSIGIFSNAQGQINSAARGRIWLNFELSCDVSCCSLQVWNRSN